MTLCCQRPSFSTIHAPELLQLTNGRAPLDEPQPLQAYSSSASAQWLSSPGIPISHIFTFLSQSERLDGICSDSLAHDSQKKPGTRLNF
jgi:hypothetical protein